MILVDIAGIRLNAEVNLKLAAIFYRRLLDDLRATWVVLRVGYTAQAETIVAGLFDNAPGKPSRF